MIQTDVIIIGAGLLGCFTARNLTRYDMNVVVLEKENDVSRGISKANTGIIYAGYDHKPGSAKSRLCIQANADFDRLCRELEVRFSRPGSLMVAYGPQADRVIRRKYEDGISSGLKDIRIISGAEAEEMEPSLREGITSALYSESTGTVDPWELCIAAYENALANGACFMFGHEVTGIERDSGRFIVRAGDEVFSAGAIVNAAGLSSDKVREMTEEPSVRLYPTAADYIVLDKHPAGAVSRVIFHEGENGKGLTLVPTADGNILIGPTDRHADEEEINAEEMRVSIDGLESLRELCMEVIPGLDLSAQIRTFGSLRPNPFEVSVNEGDVVRSGRSIKDLRIHEDRGMFSLIGIKTPGLTISNELGRLISDKTAEYLHVDRLNPDFDPCRKAITRAADLSLDRRAQLAADDPDYGEIVCSCMDITRGEVIEAVKRGGYDFESVKRRTGAGMGRCQGSRCRRKIMEICGEYKSRR